MHDQTAVHARAHYQPAHRWIQLKRREKTDPAAAPQPIIRTEPARWPAVYCLLVGQLLHNKGITYKNTVHTGKNTTIGTHYVQRASNLVEIQACTGLRR